MPFNSPEQKACLQQEARARTIEVRLSVREWRAISRLSERQPSDYRDSDLEANDKALQKGVLRRLIEGFEGV